MTKTKAVFIDRDGVINRYPGDRHYVISWDDFRFLPRVAGALQKLRRNAFKLFVVSNQAGVGKGLYPQEALDTITRNMQKELQRKHAAFDGVYYCTHRPEVRCSCRKPKTGLVKKAVAQLKKQGLTLDTSKSYFVGDTIGDIETGKKSRLTTILVFSGKESPRNKTQWQYAPDFTAKDLSDAVKQILTHNENSSRSCLGRRRAHQSRRGAV